MYSTTIGKPQHFLTVDLCATTLFDFIKYKFACGIVRCDWGDGGLGGGQVGEFFYENKLPESPKNVTKQLLIVYLTPQILTPPAWLMMS